MFEISGNWAEKDIWYYHLQNSVLPDRAEHHKGKSVGLRLSQGSTAGTDADGGFELRGLQMILSHHHSDFTDTDLARGSTSLPGFPSVRRPGRGVMGVWRSMPGSTNATGRSTLHA